MNSLGISVELTQAIYAPGDLVEGWVNFSLTHKLPCEYVTARLLGVLRTKFAIGEPEVFSPLAPRNPPRIYYRNEKTLIDRVYEVHRNPEVEDRRNSLESLQLEAFCANLPFPSLESDADIQGVEPGRHQFPIKFFLPEAGLITSFSNNGSPTIVKYSIFVNIHTGDNDTSLHEHVFSIVCPEGITKNVVDKPLVIEKNIDFEKSRDIAVSLTLSKNEFLPTEPLLCKISVTNNWKHALKYLHFNIVQRIISTGHLENYEDVKEEKVKEIEFNGVGFPESMTKIEAGSNATFAPPQYYIPALVPNINVRGLFSVEYYAQLKIGRSKSGILCTIRTPIKIGTHHKGADPVSNNQNREYIVCSREELSRSLHESPCNTTNSFYGVDLLA